MKIRDEKTKKKFIEYLDTHKEERFWQSVRNFWGVPYVLICNDLDSDAIDTFHIEADNIQQKEHDL